MSEIKFACPHCRQHIACSDEYADLLIACPACGQAMVVPVLSATESSQSKLCVVAPVPAPKRRIQSRVPQLDPWTEEAWEKHCVETTGGPVERDQLWVASSLVTLIAACVLAGAGVGMAWIVATIVVGSLLSGFLMWRNGGRPSGAGPIVAAIGGGLMASFLVIIAIPLIAFAVLFAGCAACL